MTCKCWPDCGCGAPLPEEEVWFPDSHSELLVCVRPQACCDANTNTRDFGSVHWIPRLPSPHFLLGRHQLVRHLHSKCTLPRSPLCACVCVCRFIEVRLAWGIAGIDRPDFVVWEPGVNRGNVVFYDGFNMTTRESQEFVLATCQLLRTRQCSLPGCTSGRQPNTITLPGGVKCWPEEFGSWVQVKLRQTVCTSCVRPCHMSSCWLRIQPGWRLYQWATSTFDLCRSFAH